jgi:hypothetical protein
MGGVETPLRAPAENMTFEEDIGPSVPQETAAGGLDKHNRPQYGRIDTRMRRRRRQAVFLQRACCSDKRGLDCHRRLLRSPSPQGFPALRFPAGARINSA